MKKLILKIISITLILVFSTIAFSSCFSWGKIPSKYPSFYPEGYTGGFRIDPGCPVEYWWVETYEECVDAIKLLKNHGSTFSENLKIAYDGDLFDTKYCFLFDGEKDKIKFGDNPFDRYAENVTIYTFAFFDDVSIDEINHSYVYLYEAYVYSLGEAYENEYEDITIDKLVIGDWQSDNKNYFRRVLYNDRIAIIVRSWFYVSKVDGIDKLKMTDEVLEEMINTSIIFKICNIY